MKVKRVLNVGGNNRAIPLPSHSAGFEHVLLDIDPKGSPDIVCDARELMSLEASDSRFSLKGKDVWFLMCMTCNNFNYQMD